MSRLTINEQVNITALSFRNAELKTFPKRMEYRGATYTFQDGLQYLIKKGQEIVHIFDMTDGASNFRLRCDSQQHSWTLLAISDNH